MVNLLMKAKVSTLAFLDATTSAVDNIVDRVVDTDEDGSGTFKPIENIILSLGNDAYALVATACFVVALIAFLGGLLMILANKQTQAKVENKNHLVTILFVVAGVAMTGTIISIVAGIGASVTK